MRSDQYVMLPRMASFIATTNDYQPLTDPTGSRRYLCCELTGIIDTDTPIPHKQMYAQAIHELEQGHPWYFSKQEEATIEEHNRTYQCQASPESVLLAYYEPAPSCKENFLRAVDIQQELRRHLRQADVPTINVVFAQRWRQNEFAEGALVRSLSADEHGYHGIAVVAAALLPLRHHAQKPAVEQVGPGGIVGRYTTGKLADVVGGAVPRAAAAEVVGNGVVVWSQCRAHVQLDVNTPCHADLQHLLEGNATQFAVGQLLPCCRLMLSAGILMLSSKILTIRIFAISIRIYLICLIMAKWPKFLLLLDDVIAQLIVTVEKCLDTTGNALLFRGGGCLTLHLSHKRVA